MGHTVQECLALAAAGRAKAQSERLEKVRQIHLKGALRWQMLADDPARLADPALLPPHQKAVAHASAAQPPFGDGGDTHRQPRPEPNCVPGSFDDEALTSEDFPEVSTECYSYQDAAAAAFTDPDRFTVIVHAADGSLRTLAEIEADVIRHALVWHGGRKAEVARRLGIGRSTLYRKISECEVMGQFGNRAADVTVNESSQAAMKGGSL